MKYSKLGDYQYIICKCTYNCLVKLTHYVVHVQYLQFLSKYKWCIYFNNIEMFCCFSYRLLYLSFVIIFFF